jgi:predicted esterase
MNAKPTPSTADALLLPAVECRTGDSPQCAIIWLHGLGADGHDFEPIVDEFDFDQLPGNPLRLSVMPLNIRSAWPNCATSKPGCGRFWPTSAKSQ